MNTFSCGECGETFKSPQKKRQFCSKRCASIAVNKKYPYNRYAARTKRTFSITTLITNYVDGLLLGDAHIPQGTSHATRLTQTFSIKYIEWAKVIVNDLASFGISSKITPYTTFDDRTGNTYELLSLQTLMYPEFKIYRQRWYFSGAKEVPLDIKLSDMCIKNWFLGDGYIRNRNYLQFGTESFSVQSNIFLTTLLLSQGIDMKINSENRVVTYKSGNIKQLIEKVGEVPPCFSYKIKNFQRSSNAK